MQPLTFPCPACGRLMGVGMESAGRPVRCPHCQQVVNAPALSAPTPTFVPSRRGEGAESILGDPEEAEDSLFSSAAARRVESMPTQQVPITPQFSAAVPPPPVAPVPPPYVAYQPVPVPVATETFEPTDAATPAARRATRDRNASPFPWKETALAGLVAYGLVMTVIAVLGWTRKPAVPQPTTHPTPAVVKPKK